MKEKIKVQRGGDGASGLLFFPPRPHRACRTKHFRGPKIKTAFFAILPRAQASAIGSKLVGGAGESRLAQGLIPQWNHQTFDLRSLCSQDLLAKASFCILSLLLRTLFRA
jgi:hypothetical protein